MRSNTIWEVKAKSGGGIWRLVRDRFLSLTMVLGLGFLLLISMVVTTAVHAMTQGFGRLFPIPDAVTVALSMIVGFVVVGVLFIADLQNIAGPQGALESGIHRRCVHAVLFTIGKWALGLYLGRESTGSAYGAAGSLVIVLLWVYYSSVILFMGAEFTPGLRHQERLQTPIEPVRGARNAGSARAGRNRTERQRRSRGLHLHRRLPGRCPSPDRQWRPALWRFRNVIIPRTRGDRSFWRGVFGIITGLGCAAGRRATPLKF
jgi:membrane protein